MKHQLTNELYLTDFAKSQQKKRLFKIFELITTSLELKKKRTVIQDAVKIKMTSPIVHYHEAIEIAVMLDWEGKP